ncbi:MAG: hypothetical protein WCG67_09600, partial [Ferruginibacter sp.]
PVSVNGIFKVDSVLTNALYVDVQVNITVPGTFEIRSDTINGFSFRKVGSVTFGNNIIRLYPSGKPILGGTNTFTIKFFGLSSTCKFDVTVVGPGAPPAAYTLGGTPGICTGARVDGVYTVGVPLTPANTLTVTIDVITPGTYVIIAATTSGFIFNGSGVINNIGLQNVTLTGSGTPSIAGNVSIIVSTPTLSTCTYNTTVLPSGSGGGGASQYYLQFTDGTKNIAADTSGVVAMSINNSGFVMLSVSAFSITGDTAYSVAVTTLGNPVTGVTYKTSNIGVPIGVFTGLSILNGQVYQADVSTLTQNIDIKFDVIDTVNKIVSGTFSGTAKGLTATATITNGKFRAQLQ